MRCGCITSYTVQIPESCVGTGQHLRPRLNSVTISRLTADVFCDDCIVRKFQAETWTVDSTLGGWLDLEKAHEIA